MMANNTKNNSTSQHDDGARDGWSFAQVYAADGRLQLWDNTRMRCDDAIDGDSASDETTNRPTDQRDWRKSKQFWKHQTENALQPVLLCCCCFFFFTHNA